MFGEARPDEQLLLRAFLRDDRFVVFGPSDFNMLGLGTTQLYNQAIVVNRKRHGKYTLGGRTYFFHRRPDVPAQLTVEFLVVELVNRLDDLPENREHVLQRLNERLGEFSAEKLVDAARRYGTYSTQLKF